MPRALGGGTMAPAFFLYYAAVTVVQSGNGFQRGRAFDFGKASGGQPDAEKNEAYSGVSLIEVTPEGDAKGFAAEIHPQNQRNASDGAVMRRNGDDKVHMHSAVDSQGTIQNPVLEQDTAAAAQEDLLNRRTLLNLRNLEDTDDSTKPDTVLQALLELDTEEEDDGSMDLTGCRRRGRRRRGCSDSTGRRRRGKSSG